MTPHLVKWHEQFSGDGLTIIDIDNGQIDALDDVQNHVASQQIPFAVLHDEEGVVTNTYRVQAFPSAYLIDRTGTVIWQGHPFDAPDLEARLREALNKG